MAGVFDIDLESEDLSDAEVGICHLFCWEFEDTFFVVVMEVN
jgi:hypothetical protein